MSTEEDDERTPRWAADEPTAMWDDSSLRTEGYQELADYKQEAPAAERTPATHSGRGSLSSVEVSAEVQRPSAEVQRPSLGRAPPPRSGGLSWTLVFILAAVLAVVVFVAVRFLVAS